MDQDMTDKYIPFHVREKKAHEQYNGLHDGVPEWMGSSLWAFCEPHFWHYQLGRKSGIDGDTILYLERVLRVRFPVGRNLLTDPFKEILQMLSEDAHLFLATAEALVNDPKDSSRRHGYARELAKILEDAGSAFEVAQRGVLYHLEHRVAPTVKVAFEETLSNSGRAALYLEEAWHYVYRRQPDPGAGYRKAVSAVEAVACPLVRPNDKLATLGKVIGDMKASPERFDVILQPHAGDALGKVRALCELIWTSQLDRHGTGDPDVPLNVSKDEAEMALHTATTLVHWFSRGLVRLKA